MIPELRAAARILESLKISVCNHPRPVGVNRNQLL